MKKNNIICHRKYNIKSCATLLATIIWCTTLSYAQGNKTKKLRQTNITAKGVPCAHYSGITNINEDTFAVVTDKPFSDNKAIKYWKISQSDKNGKIKSVKVLNNITDDQSHLTNRDCEDITYNAHTKTIFICGENDQKIFEYRLDGQPTGRGLNIPKQYSKDSIFANKGFESITYNASTKTYWATTEASLKKDHLMDAEGMLIRIQGFDEMLYPSKQILYKTDPPSSGINRCREYAHGISAITTLDDGRLVVVERELYIRKAYIGSKCRVKVYLIDPNDGTSSNEDKIIRKDLICKFTTSLQGYCMNLANYEGICLGKKLKDGRQTLILVNDSQNGAGNKFYRLKDYIKVLVLEN